jgi:uncharacterized membrane protein
LRARLDVTGLRLARAFASTYAIISAGNCAAVVGTLVHTLVATDGRATFVVLVARVAFFTVASVATATGANVSLCYGVSRKSKNTIAYYYQNENGNNGAPHHLQTLFLQD